MTGIAAACALVVLGGARSGQLQAGRPSRPVLGTTRLAPDGHHRARSASPWRSWPSARASTCACDAVPARSTRRRARRRTAAAPGPSLHGGGPHPGHRRTGGVVALPLGQHRDPSVVLGPAGQPPPAVAHREHAAGVGPDRRGGARLGGPGAADPTPSEAPVSGSPSPQTRPHGGDRHPLLPARGRRARTVRPDRRHRAGGGFRLAGGGRHLGPRGGRRSRSPTRTG